MSGSLDGQVIEYVDHLHQHFLDPVVIRAGRYELPRLPGYSAQMRPGQPPATRSRAARGGNPRRSSRLRRRLSAPAAPPESRRTSACLRSCRSCYRPGYRFPGRGSCIWCPALRPLEGRESPRERPGPGTPSSTPRRTRSSRSTRDAGDRVREPAGPRSPSATARRAARPAGRAAPARARRGPPRRPPRPASSPTRWPGRWGSASTSPAGARTARSSRSRSASRRSRRAEGSRSSPTVVDITARKAAENQLLQAQKLESIGRLAGGIAHDFNNMLFAIRGYAELLAEDLAPADAGRRSTPTARSAASTRSAAPPSARRP